MNGDRQRAAGLAVAAGAGLAAATPPAVVPLAEWLVVAGLAAWFLLARGAGHGVWWNWLAGAVHMAWFSWSLHHVAMPAYLAVVGLGGCYFVLAGWVVRHLPRALQGLGFGVVVAACFWARANMPEIYYPHGQPCHALWSWPALLAPLAVGGEPLANALLAWLAAALVGLLDGWRLGKPSGRLAAGRVLAVLAVWGATGWLGADPGPTAGTELRVRCAAVEPRVHPFTYMADYDRLLRQRLLEPTRELLRRRTPDLGTPDLGTPDLVLWPESSLLDPVPRQQVLDGGLALRLSLGMAPTTRFLVGGHVAVGERWTPTAWLFDAGERLVGRHEKRQLVPGGEFLPLVGILPAAAAAAIHEGFQSALGSAPNCLPGEPQPLLVTAGGVPFGALLCYDNAFPEPAASLVADGARFLCVLSNEAWYAGGAELDQLVAMTVCRAIELRTPIVRCTTDGWTVAVAASGELGDRLPRTWAAGDGPGILQTEVVVDRQRQRPVAWWRDHSGLLAGWLGALGLAHALLAWARLRAARTARTVPGPAAHRG